MTLFVHLLTVAAVFVHATLGCCTHEAHRETSEGSAVVSASDGCGSEHGGHDHATCKHDAIHGHDVQDHAVHEHVKHSEGSQHLAGGCHVQQNGAQQSGTHPCGHGNCNWLAPETRNCSASKWLQFSEDLLFRSSNLLVCDLVAGTGDCNFLADFSLPRGPVRLHLANSVLLI